MGNIVTAEANHILDSSVAGVTYAEPTTPIQLALMTTNGSATSAGTEVTATGAHSDGTYARVDITFAAASAGSISNDAAVSFTNMPSVDSPGIVGIELWDSTPTTPVRRWFGALTADKIINAGDTVTFNASSLTISFVP